MNEQTFRAAGRGPFAELQEALSELLDQVTEFAGGLGGDRGFPRYEIKVGDEGYVLYVELPGLTREEIDVTVAGRSVTISGERRAAKVPEGARLLRGERPTGRFERTIDLPGEIDAQRVVAQLRDGVLEVQLPGRSRTKGRRIDIQTEGEQHGQQ